MDVRFDRVGAILSGLSLLAAPVPLHTASAAEQPAVWRDPDGKQSGDAPERKSAGGFGAWLIATDQEKTTLIKWLLPGRTVHVRDVEEVERNSPVMAAVVFFGCKVDRRGNCDVQVKFRMTQPNGRRYFDGPWQEAWVGRRAPPAGTLEMAISYVRIVIEDGESLGKYTVHAVVADRNAKRELALVKPLVVVEAGHLKARGKRR